jgi:hypothetical protein
MSLEATPPNPQVGDVIGRWLGVANRVMPFIAQLPGLQGVSVVVPLLGALNDIENDQIALLKSIKADTAALRENPFKLALSRMEDARRVGPADSSWNTFLSSAEASLSEARGLVGSQQEKSLVEFNLGVVWLAKNHQANALHYFEESTQSAIRAVNDYVRRARSALTDDRPSPIRPRQLVSPEMADMLGGAGAVAGIVGMAALSVFTAGLALPVVAGGAAGAYTAAQAKRVRERQACKELADFLGFYNLTQRAVSVVSGNTKPEYLTLEGPAQAAEEPRIKASIKNMARLLEPEYTLRLI